jgi:hypothetical protein
MWIETSEETLSELRSKGWSLASGNGKKYLSAPDGMRLEVVKTPGLSNLYVCHARGSSRFKIGVAEQPKRRKRELQTGSPLWLDMIFTAEISSREAETRAHRLLVLSNSHGEWFDIGGRAEQFRRAVQGCQTIADLFDVFDHVKKNELAISAPD